MRFLGIGHYNDLASMCSGLVARGNQVRVFILDPAYRNVHRGPLETTPDWQQNLQWIQDAGKEGTIIFECADKGGIQNQLREQRFRVIGGSQLGNQLESNREFGQQTFRSMGLQTASSYSFSSYVEAIRFLQL